MAIGYTGTSSCGSMELVASSFRLQHTQHNCVYFKSLSSQWMQNKPQWFGFSRNKIRNVDASRRSLKMILNGYVGRDTYKMKKDNEDKIYRRLDSCLVIPPPKGKKPKAIIKFLGGAFIGAVPEVTYR